jgi:predicted transposase YbfD/YdcC
MVTGKQHSETVYGVTSLSPEKADPARLLELARGHWSIENRLHYVRDVTFDEDRCRIRKGSGAQIMASIRNLAISLLRMAGARLIAPALRACSRLGIDVLRFIGIPIQL